MAFLSKARCERSIPYRAEPLNPFRFFNRLYQSLSSLTVVQIQLKIMAEHKAAESQENQVLTSFSIDGKDKVRVFRVVKEGDVHEVVEYNVCVLLQGDIAAAWTDSDNSKIVATDSIKNTIYLFAKSSQNVLTPELFGMEIGEHFLRTYDHIDVAEIEITKLKWSRLVSPFTEKSGLLISV